MDNLNLADPPPLPATVATMIHVVPVRELAERRIEVLADGRIRVATWRRSPATQDAADFVMVSGVVFTLDEARELRSALALAIAKVEQLEGPA